MLNPDLNRAGTKLEIIHMGGWGQDRPARQPKYAMLGDRLVHRLVIRDWFEVKLGHQRLSLGRSTRPSLLGV